MCLAGTHLCLSETGSCNVGRACKVESGGVALKTDDDSRTFRGQLCTRTIYTRTTVMGRQVDVLRWRSAGEIRCTRRTMDVRQCSVSPPVRAATQNWAPGSCFVWYHYTLQYIIIIIMTRSVTKTKTDYRVLCTICTIIIFIFWPLLIFQGVVVLKGHNITVHQFILILN